MKYFEGKIFFILGFLLCSGFFCCQNCLADAAGAAVINEIAWMGTASSSNAEWIELKNPTEQSIDLTGWMISAADGSPKINLSGNIPANGYFLLQRKVSTVTPLPEADYLYDYGRGALSNDGEDLRLMDSQGNVIDAADFSQGWKWKGLAAGENSAKKTAERCGNDWQTSLDPGGTPGAANDCSVAGDPAAEEQAAPPPAAASGGSSAPAYRYGDVVINEFESDPPAGENEWVELYNPGGGAISLSGWTIADGSGKETPLQGGFDENNYFFFIAEKFKGTLNNDGDEILLYSDTHTLIDEVAYGKYGDQPDNNALAPGKGQSAALKIDGKKALFDKDSYAITATPTKGATNIITAPVGQDDNATSSAAVPSNIAITEILPNPAGSDRAGEFIELHNNSAAMIDLTGWRLEIAGGRSFAFGKYFNPTSQLPAGGFFALYRSASNLVLDNNGGTIKLYAPGKTRVAQTLQYDEAEEGFSYCDTAQLDLANADGATRKYLANSLLGDRWVWNGEPTPGKANQVKPLNHAPQASFFAPENIVVGQTITFDASDSFDEDGDFLYFAWDFGDGGRQIIEDPVHTFVAPGKYQVKLAVSDGRETTTSGKFIKVGGIFLAGQADSAGSAPAGSDPAASPAITKIAATGQPLVLAENSGKTIKTKVASPVKTKTKTPAAPVLISPATAISLLKLGKPWKISGTVIVLPGTFGTQYFYVINESPLGRGGDAPGGDGVGQPAVKIYNYYHDFPSLIIGDEIKASGVIGGSVADKYLKTKSAADIKIIARGEPPAPEKITAAGFKEENLGKFVQASGEYEGKNGSLITLFDGEADFNVYLKSSANLSTAGIKSGAEIVATGLLSKVSGNLVIMPRFQADLAVASSSADVAGQILAAATGSSAWTLPAGENKNPLPLYGLITAGGIIIVAAGIFWKKANRLKQRTTESAGAEDKK